MAGSHEGAIKTRDKILETRPDYYSDIGSIGGKAKRPTKGFGFDRERASASGRIGGAKSSRKGIPNKQKKAVANKAGRVV